MFGFVYCAFGGDKPIQESVVPFFGAVLAFSGLMAKRYLYKETIEYLAKWVRVNSLIKIICEQLDKDREIVKDVEDFNVLKAKAKMYANYIKTELKIVPALPMVLIVLYGSSLFAYGSFVFQAGCLGSMLLVISYLAVAAISSNCLAIDQSDLDEIILKLEAITIV